ncbi:MAG: hypothetical protein H8E70_09285 [Candidatus Marinimicrobia bacterium]|nr:hypothetical protein [Candidatus Neomarinimicrobiota bacterium]
MSIFGLVKSAIGKSRKPKLFNKKIASVASSKSSLIVTFTDGKKSRFYRRYSSKLLVNNIVEFYGYPNREWINPARNPKLFIIEQAPTPKVSGKLQIHYVSRLKEDEMGEYVYLPNCILTSDDGDKKRKPALIYLDKVGLNPERLGVYQGYGVIEGEFSLLGDIIEVNRIDDFQPEIKTVKEEVKLSNVLFHIDSLSVTTPKGVFHCSSDIVPFKFTPTHNNFKKLYEDMTVSISAIQRKIGKVHKEGNKWVENIEWIQTGESVWDFSNVDNSKIAQAIEKQKMDEEYEKLLKELKQLKEFVSFSDLKKKFKKTGRTVSSKDLSAMFFHPGYDEEVFHILETNAIETFVDNLSFVFKVPNEGRTAYKFVWEVPNRTLATYVFSDVLEPKQLFSRLEETKRMDIRTNKDIQKALGFDGFIIHTNTESWNEKYRKLLNVQKS